MDTFLLKMNPFVCCDRALNSSNFCMFFGGGRCTDARLSFIGARVLCSVRLLLRRVLCVWEGGGRGECVYAWVGGCVWVGVGVCVCGYEWVWV